MIGDYFLFAVNSIRHRKLRAWLTIIGIVVGVAAIISLIMISRGLERSIEEQFSQFGANRILISARGFQGPGSQSEGLTLDDVDTVEKVGGFEYVTPGLFRQVEITHNKEVGFTLVGGIPAEDFEQFFEDSSIEIGEGRFIQAGDKTTAIIGTRVAKEMFDNELTVGSKIEIGKIEFRVVGILEEIGNSQDDNAIDIPFETAQEIFNTGNKVDTMVVQVKTGGNIKLLQDNQDFLKIHSDTTKKQFIEIAQNKNLTDKIDTLNATHDTLDTILHLYDDTTKLADVMGYVVEKLHREGKIAQAQSLYLMWNELLPELYID